VFNTNYAAGGFTQSQQELFDSLFPNPAAGAGVQYITVSLGGNDVLGLFNNPGFFAQSIPTQEAQITAAVSTFATNDAAILAGVRSEFPDAEILVVGYPDAFAGLDASTLINEGVSPLALPLVQGDAAFGTTEANAAFENLAALPDVDGRFVDLSTPFAGNEANWTLINTIDEGSGTPDYHPNNVGYQEIADDVFSVATTPEPGSLSLALAAGAAGIAAAVSRRRRRAA
jgi:MYXO-CTERM domain-containing protein